MSKTKIEPAPESVIQVKRPMVRDFSTGGGHLPGDTLVEDYRQRMIRTTLPKHSDVEKG
jgi:hypothetical protein